MWQMLTSMKGEINSSTIIVEDFNIPLTSMDRPTEQTISKETQTLNDTMDPMDPKQWIQKQDPYILSTRDPPQNKGHTQT